MGAVPGQHYEPVPLQDIEPERLRTFAAEHGWRFLLAVQPEPQENKEDEEVGFALLYFGKALRANSTTRVYLKDHHLAVGEKARELGRKVRVNEELVRALERAGELHDLGKQERIWQKAAGNTDREGKLRGDLVAKPILPMRGRDLGGFRHELASLYHAKQELKDAGFSPEVCDLVLHLIAAHHGHARPCFQERACDRNRLRESARLALETVQRFGRLQERYGAWGLAYLESILKAADGLASADANAEEEPAGA
jgi:CRISPR-associated endonuclease/helicase Cas3